jgi:hypothetical protein
MRKLSFSGLQIFSSISKAKENLKKERDFLKIIISVDGQAL